MVVLVALEKVGFDSGTEWVVGLTSRMPHDDVRSHGNPAALSLTRRESSEMPRMKKRKTQQVGIMARKAE